MAAAANFISDLTVALGASAIGGYLAYPGHYRPDPCANAPVDQPGSQSCRKTGPHSPTAALPEATGRAKTSVCSRGHLWNGYATTAIAAFGLESGMT